jgi:threonyl-tRNA synthetase
VIALSLPDGSVREFEGAVTGLELARSISPRLAKEAVFIKVDQEDWDLTRPITENARVQIITRDTPEGLELLRHDAAHVFAQAVKELYPETQISIGPAIENGFYYDLQRDESFTPEDLVKLEKRMAEIVDRDEPIVREIWDREKAIAYFNSIGEHLKVEIIESIPGDEPLSFYRQGPFIDLCRGPHLPSTKPLGKAFKLMKLAGAYWRGDSNNIMLQRVYGTAWSNEKQLAQYLTMLEEAEKRDHRRLGKALDLFHLQEEAPGCVFWHPNGWTIYVALQQYMRERQRLEGYQEVNTPMLVDRALWEASGHWEKFREAMFGTEEAEDKHLLVKPMNCPCHVQIFKQGLKSYRDLPLRLAEFGACHRNEPSGSLHGIMRVRGFTQDDAHIFCTMEQIKDETIAFVSFLRSVYKDLGFEDIRVKFSDRPEVRAGSDDVWNKAEGALREATEAAGLEYTLNPGEGAFYGPKLEFVIKDAVGRDWQCGTLQVDMVLPERLGAQYIAETGEKRTAVMVHRAILGSFERFIGILIEHHAGKFPLWLAPVQAVVCPITSDWDAYAEEVCTLLKNKGIRVKSDIRNEKISYKIREWSHQKVPYILVVGKKEAQERQVTLRQLGSEVQEMLALQQTLDKLVQESQNPVQQRKAEQTNGETV